MAFKMRGYSAFTKPEETKADMPAVTVTPGMEAKRDENEYNTLNTKLQDNGFLEDDEAKRYHALAQKLGKN